MIDVLPSLRRRHLLAAGGALAATGIGRAGAQGSDERTLRFVPQANLSILDPVWTPLYVIRNHGYMVYDTLYGVDRGYAPKPQMLDGHEVLEDGRRWVLQLRPGLVFHDNEPVRAADCVSSIRRWAGRNTMGQLLLSATDSLSVLDDRRFEFRLKQPFPFLSAALSTISGPVLFIMPARIADASPGRPVSDAVGSGPFRFVRDEWVQGSRSVYAKFDRYAPRMEPPAGTAGGKVVNVPRVVWTVIPDAATAAAALQSGEVDWLEQPLIDTLPLLSANRSLTVRTTSGPGMTLFMRMNQAQPPFDNPKVRQALLTAIVQKEFLDGAVGNPAYEVPCASFFSCGEALSPPPGAVSMPGDLDRARRLLRDSGYTDGRVVLLIPADRPVHASMAIIAGELMTRVGFKVDQVTLDWGSLLSRIGSREGVDKGGWSMFPMVAEGGDMLTPATNPLARSNGAAAFAGWPDDPRMEAMLAEWLATTDPARQRGLTAEYDRQAGQSLPFLPLGQYRVPTAFRNTVSDVLDTPMPLFWNLRKA